MWVFLHAWGKWCEHFSTLGEKWHKRFNTLGAKWLKACHALVHNNLERERGKSRGRVWWDFCCLSFLRREQNFLSGGSKEWWEGTFNTWRIIMRQSAYSLMLPVPKSSKFKKRKKKLRKIKVCKYIKKKKNNNNNTNDASPLIPWQNP